MAATLTFDDEFNTLNLYSRSTGKGTWDTTYWWADGVNSKGETLTGNNEQEWYINSDYAPTSSVKPWSVSNGTLDLQAAPASSSISSQIGGYKYTSGMLNTYHSFSQTYGYFEVRAELPAGQGLWPAFWLLPEDGSWPPEIDAMEVLGNDPTKLYTTVHSSTLAGGQESINGGTTVANTSTGYHTYAVDWEKDHITWYFDNKEVYQVATPADVNKPMYMLLNLAVGGSWPGSPNSSTQFPADMKVDYVKAWTSDPYTDGTATSTTGSTTTTTPPATGTSSTGTASSGGASTSTGSTGSTGQVLTATHTASVLTGGAGADTLIASQANDTLTGGAGADVFVFKTEPYSPIHITDFKVGVDKLDLSALFKAAGYTGSNPVADGYIYLDSDGSGGTTVRFDHDGHGPNPVWPNTIIDLQGVAPTSVTWSQLSGTATTSGSTSTGTTSTGTTSTGTTSTGSTSTSSGGSTGQVLSTSQPHVALTGGAGADTLTAGPGYDTLTGGAGADHFVLTTEPWAPITITDFQVGVDKLDLSALLKTAGYTGSDPVADGYVYLQSDGAGGTLVRFDHDGHGPNPVWPNTIVDLQGVSPTNVAWSQISGTSTVTSTAAVSSTASTTTVTSSASTANASSTASGQVLTATQPHVALTGGAGADTLIAGPGYDTLTGGAGADHFVLQSEPWAPITIKDFQPGVDKLDFSAMLKAAGYTGSDPVADGYLYVESDGAGGSLLRFDHDGHGPNPVWPNTIVDLVGVAPSQVKASDWIIH